MKITKKGVVTSVMYALMTPLGFLAGAEYEKGNIAFTITVMIILMVIDVVGINLWFEAQTEHSKIKESQS